MPTDENDSPPPVESTPTPPAPQQPLGDDSPKAKLKEIIEGDGGLEVQFHRDKDKKDTTFTYNKRDKKP